MKESSKSILDTYITVLAQLVDYLTPNHILSDVKYIEENIHSISECYKQFTTARENIWYHWENIVMSDLKDSIKQAFFSRFKNSFKFNHNRYLKYYNESTFKKVKSEKLLYETTDLKLIIYRLHGMLDNDLIEFERILNLYQLKVTSMGNNNTSSNPRKNEDKNNSAGMSEDNFYHLIRKFQLEILERENYLEKIRHHRNPAEPKNELLNKLYKYNLEIQNRQEMRDYDPETNSLGYAPSIIKDIWMADKRIKTLYLSVKKYCELRNKNFETIAIHIAEFRAVNKLISKMRREIRKWVSGEQATSQNSSLKYFWQGTDDQKLKLFDELTAELFIQNTNENKTRFLNNQTVKWKQDGRSLFYLLHQLKQKKYNMLGRFENLGPIIRDNFVDKNGKAFKNIKQNANGMYSSTQNGKPRLAETIVEVLKKTFGN
jgi:hypothetical protein